jgi:hypothetical protein
LIKSITKIELSIDISNGLSLKSAPDPLPKLRMQSRELTKIKLFIESDASEERMSLSKNSHNNQDYLAQKDTILFRVQLI